MMALASPIIVLALNGWLGWGLILWWQESRTSKAGRGLEPESGSGPQIDQCGGDNRGSI